MYTSIRQSLLSCCTKPLDQGRYQNILWELSDTFPCCQLHTIGTSPQGHSIYAVSLGGEGELRSVAYIGGIDGRDWISTAILLRFVADYCILHQDGERLYRVHLPYLYANRRICICPRFNCDGAEAVKNGEKDAGCRNSLGADIHTAFETLEHSGSDTARCPEALALRQYLQYQSPSLLMTLFGCSTASTHGTDNENKESTLLLPRHPSSRTGTVGRLLSRMLSCSLTEAVSVQEPNTALINWFADTQGHPAFSAVLGLEAEEDGFYRGYASSREALFSLPLLV